MQNSEVIVFSLETEQPLSSMVNIIKYHLKHPI